MIQPDDLKMIIDNQIVDYPEEYKKLCGEICGRKIVDTTKCMKVVIIDYRIPYFRGAERVNFLSGDGFLYFGTERQRYLEDMAKKEAEKGVEKGAEKEAEKEVEKEVEKKTEKELDVDELAKLYDKLLSIYNLEEMKNMASEYYQRYQEGDARLKEFSSQLLLGLDMIDCYARGAVLIKQNRSSVRNYFINLTQFKMAFDDLQGFEECLRMLEKR